MVVLRHNRHEQHSAASMKVVETTLNDDDINLSKQYYRSGLLSPTSLPELTGQS
jgi:hypothetical protein